MKKKLKIKNDNNSNEDIDEFYNKFNKNIILVAEEQICPSKIAQYIKELNQSIIKSSNQYKVL